MLVFDEYFQSVYGDRWPGLREALLAPPVQAVFVNPFIQKTPERVKSLTPLGEQLYLHEPAFAPERDSSGWLDTYILDPASVFVARSLGVEAGDKVLDMCAAPGGKSLVIFSELPSCELISNDLSSDRRLRMKKIFEQYIPEGARTRLHIKAWDGLQFGLRMKSHFDRIILDAPCSGERHLMSNSKDLSEWKLKRSENLTKRQYGLLCSALLALKPGGHLIYSTCSMNPMENDGVIERLLKKKGSEFRVEDLPNVKDSEKTHYGLQFLPDVCGYGPMFCCKIHKHEGLSPD